MAVTQLDEPMERLPKDTPLYRWLQADLKRRGISVPPEALCELVEQAERSVRRHLERPARLRPSAMAKELQRLSKHLTAAKSAAERLGDDGLLHIIAASGANIDDASSSMTAHLAYLERMAGWSQRAAVTARELSLSAQDGRGGPTPDYALRTLIADLMLIYQHVLGVRPSHTVNKDIHLADVGFTGFVKQALSFFLPEGMTFEPKLIDNVVRELLDMRDLELFEPPHLP